MAMIKCHECGNPVSSSAKACPTCGVKPKNNVSRVIWWTFAFVFGVPLVVSSLVGGGATAPSAPRAEDTDGLRMVRAERWLKESMRDPGSFEVDGVGMNPATKYICIQYRARNGFGGMNRENAVLTDKDQWVSSEKLVSEWAKHCTVRLVD